MKNKIKNPLESFDHWEDVLLECYSEKNTKTNEEYREYDTFALTEGVRTFYKLNHQFQAYDFVCQKEKEFLSFKKSEMSLWEAIDFLNTLVDDSDCDIDLDQILKDYLAKASLFMIRYHSFFAQLRKEAYNHLINKEELELFDWVRKFNAYDLHSKIPTPTDSIALGPYYKDLVAKFLPITLRFNSF